MLDYKIVFSIKSNVTDTLTPLRIRVSYNGERTELYSKIKVKPSEWNSELQTISVKNDNRLKTKTKIENIIEDIFKEFDVIERRYPEPYELKKSFSEKYNPKNKKDKNPLKFTELIDLYISENRTYKQWSDRTLLKYNKYRNHILGFDQNLEVKDINDKKLKNLVDYFLTGPIDYRNGKKKSAHNNYTVKRSIRDYLSILNWGFKKQLYTGTSHQTFEQRFKGTEENLSELIYLEWNELIALYNKDFSNNKKYDKVRDVFCFCCFTSLRYSDVEKLRRSDIKDNHIIVSTKKTSDHLVINLNDYSRTILKKYEDKVFPNDCALPVMSNQKANEYLKEIGAKMEFNTPIKRHYYIGNTFHEEVNLKKDVLSTHAARRTFVVNALRLKIPSEVIRDWTGHKNERAMNPYKKIVDELKESEMSKFNFTPENTPKNIIS
ncbi:site-specific integrase [Chryseobacterium sp. JV274]|uniref:site-specific integrase n=1 Tax=Chryseobacterium sp. JV274 TaxID=1932669 RepID=UPI000984FB7E|nr:site-specific integrase [Chryseobacterium sp. JV274]